MLGINRNRRHMHMPPQGNFKHRLLKQQHNKTISTVLTNSSHVRSDVRYRTRTHDLSGGRTSLRRLSHRRPYTRQFCCFLKILLRNEIAKPLASVNAWCKITFRLHVLNCRARGIIPHEKLQTCFRRETSSYGDIKNNIGILHSITNKGKR